MINHNPTDISCVYTTLFVSREAKKQNIMPIITFDQPLYWKTIMILSCELTDNILKNTIVLL